MNATSFAFELRQQIRRNEDGIWVLFTGTDLIPHETWQQAWDHSQFIHRIRTGNC